MQLIRLFSWFCNLIIFLILIMFSIYIKPFFIIFKLKFFFSFFNGLIYFYFNKFFFIFVIFIGFFECINTYVTLFSLTSWIFTFYTKYFMFRTRRIIFSFFHIFFLKLRWFWFINFLFKNIFIFFKCFRFSFKDNIFFRF